MMLSAFVLCLVFGLSRAIETTGKVGLDLPDDPSKIDLEIDRVLQEALKELENRGNGSEVVSNFLGRSADIGGGSVSTVEDDDGPDLYAGYSRQTEG